MKAGSTSIRLLAAGNTVFDLIDEGVESEERSTFTNALSEAGPLYRPRLKT